MAILTLFLISIFTSHVYSSCMRNPLISKITKYGNVDQYCVYNDLKLLPGSSFKLAAPVCTECQCTKQGLQCCGFGFGAGVISPPEGCITHNDACNLIIVKKEKPSELCIKPNSTNRRKNNRG